MLWNRQFQAVLGSKLSARRVQKNELAQGSLLAPTYFQHVFKRSVSNFLKAIQVCRWHLTSLKRLRTTSTKIRQPSVVSAAQHVKDRVVMLASQTNASWELNIFLNGEWLAHNPKSACIQVTLAHTLTHQQNINLDYATDHLHSGCCHTVVNRIRISCSLSEKIFTHHSAWEQTAWFQVTTLSVVQAQPFQKWGGGVCGIWSHLGLRTVLYGCRWGLTIHTYWTAAHLMLVSQQHFPDSTLLTPKLLNG